MSAIATSNNLRQTSSHYSISFNLSGNVSEFFWSGTLSVRQSKFRKEKYRKKNRVVVTSPQNVKFMEEMYDKVCCYNVFSHVRLSCAVLNLLFHWSPLIGTSIVLRDRGIVMLQSLLFSQPITNNRSKRWPAAMPIY